MVVFDWTGRALAAWEYLAWTDVWLVNSFCFLFFCSGGARGVWRRRAGCVR